MNEIEQADKMLSDLLLNGKITLRGNPLSLAEMSKLIAAKQLLAKKAAEAVAMMAVDKGPLQGTKPNGEKKS